MWEERQNPFLVVVVVSSEVLYRMKDIETRTPLRYPSPLLGLAAGDQKRSNLFFFFYEGHARNHSR